MAWTDRYVTASAAGGGAGTSGNPWTWVEAWQNMAAGMRINVKAGTYNESSTALQIISTAGTLSSPIWFRGYNSTIGDLDDAPLSQLTPGTDMPQINRTASYHLYSGLYVHQSSVAWTSSVNNRPNVYIRTGRASVRRCRFENTGTGASGGYGARADAGNYNSISDCYFSAASSNDAGLYVGVNTQIADSIFAGGKYGIENVQGGHIGVVLRCVFDSNATAGLYMSSTTAPTSLLVSESTFYDSVDGILCKGTNSSGVTCINRSYFHTMTGDAINFDSATFGNLLIAANAYHNITGSQLVGVHESRQFDAITDSSDYFANAPGGDFTLSASSNAHDVQHLLEKAGPSSYHDIGAVQAQLAGGGGGNAAHGARLHVIGGGLRV